VGGGWGVGGKEGWDSWEGEEVEATAISCLKDTETSKLLASSTAVCVCLYVIYRRGYLFEEMFFWNTFRV
jgi:hypothetical protein